MDEGAFILDGKLKTTSINQYTIVPDEQRRPRVVSEDNFTRLDVTPTALTVKVYTRKGDPVGSAIGYRL